MPDANSEYPDGMSAATKALNDGAAAAPVVGPANTVFAVAVVAPVPPLATGRVPVTFAVKEQYVVDVDPVPPLAIGNVPETWVVRPIFP